MFTGIIGATGIVQKVVQARGGRGIVIKMEQKISRRISEGGSVAIDGVCLTALRGRSQTLTFELMDSTLRRTTLGTYKAGDHVNVEAAVRAGQEIGGHYLSGHVDGIAEVCEIKKRGNTGYYRFKISTPLMRYLVPQGSIAINGVSLTVVEVGRDWCSVALTPYTRAHTNLGDLKVGDRANVEVDMMAKYIFNFLNLSSRGRSRGDLTGLPRRLRAPRNDGVYEVSHRRGKI